MEGAAAGTCLGALLALSLAPVLRLDCLCWLDRELGSMGETLARSGTPAEGCLLGLRAGSRA